MKRFEMITLDLSDAPETVVDKINDELPKFEGIMLDYIIDECAYYIEIRPMNWSKLPTEVTQYVDSLFSE